MNFKDFFVKKILMSYFVSVTFICVVMALVGTTFDSGTRFGYEAFLSPLIFGAVASLPLLVKYSKNELSVKQTALRSVIHFILLEVVILLVLYFEGIITSMSMAISLVISIFIIDLTVNLVLWINDKRTAKEFNDALKRMQNHYGAD
jgi:hypothetical protein